MFEKSTQLLEAVLPDDDVSLAVCYSNIAQVHYILGNEDMANDYLKKTLKIQLKPFPQNHPHLATSYSILGSIYHRQSKLKRALKMYKEALSIQVKCFLSDHPDIATTNNSISQIRSALNE